MVLDGDGWCREGGRAEWMWVARVYNSSVFLSGNEMLLYYCYGVLLLRCFGEIRGEGGWHAVLFCVCACVRE